MNAIKRLFHRFVYKPPTSPIEDRYIWLAQSIERNIRRPLGLRELAVIMSLDHNQIDLIVKLLAEAIDE
ncbi:hypothetical protein KIH86_24120 [Paenibacillus sp. HN-1]|uniref:hypothetical protein n=1 Tax=Paenibacillus TaxID=44249 RepID=UPI001CA89E79|nr:MULTISPECIES: hypothetical protein [Paenibacillus]MBY9081237.1 hypothetical protein [Paenibacillus sp. CGMCC 1.18879]MBY9087274.1 hypothetical protein [Paenibacillus sinensis]